MEILTSKIGQFLAVSSGDGSGAGSGAGTGYGTGYGTGSGAGTGAGTGSGYGDGAGYGDGTGAGYGSGDGTGAGYGSGDGIKSINGRMVHNVDGLETIITAVHGNIAKGFILQRSLQLTPCFIVKSDDKFAHGETLHQAWTALQEKLYEDCPIADRIEKFCQAFPDFNRAYPAKDLFSWHHILTGSCLAGRTAFCKDHGIAIDKDQFTIHQFIDLTKDSYGGEIIKKLSKHDTHDTRRIRNI